MAQLSRCENIDRVAYPRDWQFCMRAEAGGGGGGGAGGSYSGYDCIDCEAARAPEGPSPWVEALGIVAGPLAMVGSVWLGSYYQNRTQEAWAGAYTRGHEECTSRYNSFLSYYESRGANPITPEMGFNAAGTVIAWVGGAVTPDMVGRGAMVLVAEEIPTSPLAIHPV